VGFSFLSLEGLAGSGLELVRKVNPNLRRGGRDWPLSAHTMIGIKRVKNLASEEVIKSKVPG